MKPFEDPGHRGNASRYWTGKTCCEEDCDLPAGTAWSPYWCQKHNAERILRITKTLTDLLEKKRRARGAW